MWLPKKSQRLELAEDLLHAWYESGAENVEKRQGMTPKHIHLRARKGDANVFVEIGPHGTGLAHWFAETGTEFTFPDWFPDVNPYHRRKATTDASAVPGLLAKL